MNLTLLPLSNTAIHLSRLHQAIFYALNTLRPGDGERPKDDGESENHFNLLEGR
ncbi:MAG: hypothetical protein ACK583_10120 [Cyanobacteriota bacterium]